MATPEYEALFECYAAVIENMSTRFTSHEFIRELARQQQVLYIEALYANRHVLHNGKPAPFMIVHGQLARQLESYPHLVRKISSAVSSQDLFGAANTAALWEKV